MLADGRVVRAAVNEHTDLRRALKGGSGNLGLVTRLDMYVIDFPDPGTPNTWGGVAV